MEVTPHSDSEPEAILAVLDLCERCQRLADDELRLTQHWNCHGWYHCGPSCCGTCPTCIFNEDHPELGELR